MLGFFFFFSCPNQLQQNFLAMCSSKPTDGNTAPTYIYYISITTAFFLYKKTDVERESHLDWMSTYIHCKFNEGNKSPFQRLAIFLLFARALVNRSRRWKIPCIERDKSVPRFVQLTKLSSAGAALATACLQQHLAIL
jgi:hypothetical protein